jgi:hypothetical protein
MAKKVSKLKKTLDMWFSRYIRLRDSVAFGKYGWCRCCSCGKVDEIKNVDAGHFINRKNNIVRYDATNVHAQCRRCNRFDEGNAAGYSLFMLEEYGQDHIDHLDELHHQFKKFTPDELEELITLYKGQVKEIQKEHGKIWS